MKSRLFAPLLSGLLALSSPVSADEQTPKGTVETLEKLVLPTPDYHSISTSPIRWKEIDHGLAFTNFEVYRGTFAKELVDRIAAVRINPQHQSIRVITGYKGPHNVSVGTIEEWHTETGATVLFNSAQYSDNPYYHPDCQIITGGRTIPGKRDDLIRGMFVSEPRDPSLPLADIIDFGKPPIKPKNKDHLEEYKKQLRHYELLKQQKLEEVQHTYQEAVAHWPILLDKHGTIRAKKTDWQANRTVVAKDHEKNILVFTTEGGFFTLYHFGQFLRDQRDTFHVITAMSMDGGYEAEMLVQKNGFRYVTYGQFETYGPKANATIPNARIRIPTVIGVFPRK